ncbi:MAG: hypothetical protein IJB84_01040 [Lachnospiraceae bacterium]|nr:hypothetical protein [Lachnospiraceae bacterium]
MLELLFAIGMIWVFGKLLLFGIKAAWSITKILCIIILLPVILVGLVVGGLIWLAFPILIVIGIVALVMR